MSENLKIPFLKIHFGQEEKRALVKVLESGWWTAGPVTLKFEEKFAGYVGAKYAVFVSSATEALFLALKALQLRNVTFRVPSLTFTASAGEIIHSGNKIEFIDVDKDTICASGDYHKPLLKVHFGGNYSLAQGKPVIEDSAHLVEKNQCKNNPNIVCFSFAYAKNITCGEGGMVATNDKKIYDWLIKARFFGINRFGLLNNRKHPDWPYQVDFLGWKSNATEFQAALGLVQLAKLEKINKRRRKIVNYYNREFDYQWQGLHLYPIFVKERSKFLRAMIRAGIQCSVHYIPLHWMKAYQPYCNKKISLPNTEWLGKHLVTLPLYPDLSDIQVEYIVKNVKKIVKNSSLLKI